MSNPNARGQLGNKGGGRLGYQYEKDQLVRLRKIVDRAVAQMEAIQKGKVGDKELARYKALEKTVLKALDKLQPNKQYIEHGGEIRLPTPLLANLDVSDNNSDQENITPT